MIEVLTSKDRFARDINLEENDNYVKNQRYIGFNVNIDCYI